MNKEQLNEWIKSAKFVDDDEEEIDEFDNKWGGNIYEKDGELWSIPTLNGKLYERIVRDDYMPQKVIRKTEIIKRIFYEPI